ncbi:MAG: hypothetical protein ABI481_03550 [Pyrinomonadaceae bacterium]
MIKRLVQCSKLLLIAVAASTFTVAQTNYVLPRMVNLDPVVRKNFRSFYVRSYPGGPIQKLSTDGFYPIGWSRDGKFAYYSEPVDEECGCYFAELTIVDLRTDKVLWEFENKPTERMNDKGEPIPDDMRKLWARNNVMFSQKLREHGIQQVGRFALMPATFASGGKSFAAKVASVKSNDPDGLNRIRKIDLTLSSPSLGKKSLYTAEYKGDDMYVSPLDAAVAGIFKSPFEKRVAVIMIKVQRGWEGPPHTVEAQIAGADLVNGFRK